MILKFPVLILDGFVKGGPDKVPLTPDNVRFQKHCTVSRNFNKTMTDRLGVCHLFLVENEQSVRELWAEWDFPSDKVPNTFHLYSAVGGAFDNHAGYFNLDEVAICLTPNEDERIKSIQHYAKVEVLETPQVIAETSDEISDPPGSQG